MDVFDRLLQSAKQSHHNTTKHTNIMVGMNFIECFDCHKHAHVQNTESGLFHHDSGYTFCDKINPEDF